MSDSKIKVSILQFFTYQMPLGFSFCHHQALLIIMKTPLPNLIHKLVQRMKPIAFLLLLVWMFVGCDVLRDLTTDRPKTPPSSGDSNVYGPVPPSTYNMSATERKLRGDITGFAQKQVGVRYQSAGKIPETGFDCSGFTSYVMNNFNIKISPSSRDQALQGRSVEINKVKPGDLVFYRRSVADPIFHVSMVVENTGPAIRVIHSTSSRGVIVEDILASKYWRPYIDSARDVVAARR
jgi:NlpC/P60 family